MPKEMLTMNSSPEDKNSVVAVNATKHFDQFVRDHQFIEGRSIDATFDVNLSGSKKITLSVSGSTKQEFEKNFKTALQKELSTLTESGYTIESMSVDFHYKNIKDGTIATGGGVGELYTVSMDLKN